MTLHLRLPLFGAAQGGLLSDPLALAAKEANGVIARMGKGQCAPSACYSPPRSYLRRALPYLQTATAGLSGDLRERPRAIAREGGYPTTTGCMYITSFSASEGKQ